MLDILLDALLDTAKLIPFLFLTYLAMEYLEHKTSMKILIAVQKAGNFGPVIGGVLGAVPQCGFSAAASGLYAGKVISLGTLMAIYMSTSDEMLPILISEKANIGFILAVIGAKVGIGIFWGLMIDWVFFRKINAAEHIHIHTMCEQEHCNCDKGLFGSAVKHTLQITLFVFIINLALGAVMEFAGEEVISNFILNSSILGPIITAFVGLIPNCAASVVITQLYLNGAIGVGSMMAGLLSSAGVGWLVYLRASHNAKRTGLILSLMFAMGALSGIIIELIW